MNPNPGLLRALGVLALALPLVLLSDLRLVEATCGGGGGGGMGGGSSSGGTEGTGKDPAYVPTWSTTFSEATSKATTARKAVWLYFLPENEKTSHSFFKTKMAYDFSNESGMLRIQYVKDDPLREELKVPKHLHVLHVCDWYGNSLKSFGVTMKDKFPYPSIESVMKALPKLVEGNLKRLEGNLKSATEKIDKDPIDALKALGELVTYRGHEIVNRAKPVITKIEAAATPEIDAALKIEDKKARAKELEKIKTRYKGLRKVAERCDKEIEAATGMAPARDIDAGLARNAMTEAVDDYLAKVDESRRAPSIAERAHQAMVDGLNCEIREEYEKALEHYAMASGLDPRDSVALVYLGELYRHHLGRWDDARRTFDRVVELDNDPLAMAVALHGLGKMTIWDGKNEEGLKLFEASLQKKPTALCYRNLAVFWNTENEFKKAFEYATKAFDLDPADRYNQVFYAIYLILDGQKEKGEGLIKGAQFDPSMSYNYACYYAALGKRDLVFKYLHRHFYGYERFDDVRRFEMAEARMDIHFKKYKDDPKFIELTSLAAK